MQAAYKEQGTLSRALWTWASLMWKRSRWQMVFLLLMSALPGLLSALSIPALERFVEGVEAAALGSGWKLLTEGAVILCAVNLMARSLGSIMDYVRHTSCERIKADLTAMLMRAFSRKEPICFENPEVLKSTEKAWEGIEHFEYFTHSVVSDGLYTLVYTITMAVYLAAHSWVLAAVLLLSVIPMIVVQKKLQAMNESFQDKRAAMKREFDYCESCMVGREMYKETRLLGAFQYFFDRYTRHIRDFCHFRTRHILREKWMDAKANVLSMAGFAVMLAVLVAELCTGRLSSAAFAAVLSSLLTIFFTVMRYFTNVFWLLAQELPTVGNLFRALDLPERQGETAEADGLKGVKLTDVHFRYPGAAQEAVRGVTLEIRPKETIAVVGENGAGKTTLVRLMTGLYLPDTGTVEIGGQDTHRLDLPSAVGRMSAVFQKYMKYPLKLSENVRISDPSCQEEISGVLAQAGLEVSSASFPQGGETMLSREFDGVDLSGGQWQRVAIARGLYRAHGMIVLDEPTAAIDPLEETRIYRQFADLARDRTAVVVTHRIGSARIADRIIVMENGLIAECGTHDQLMEQNGSYARMVEAQAEWYQ